jgi:hypothetical protein
MTKPVNHNSTITSNKMTIHQLQLTARKMKTASLIVSFSLLFFKNSCPFGFCCYQSRSFRSFHDALGGDFSSGDDLPTKQVAHF